MSDAATFFEMKTVEVYVHYDRPLLFACRNALGQLYLTVLVEEEDEFEIWIYAAVSPRRLEHIRSGGIDLYTAFKQPEMGFVYVLRTSFVNHDSEITIKEASQLPEDWLPAKNTRLNLETATIKEPVERRALQALREVVDLKLTFPRQLRSEAPAHVLGEVLKRFQDLVNQMGNYFMEMPAWFNVVGFKPGSFQVELESDEPANLFKETRTAEILKELTSLIDISKQDEALTKRLHDLHPSIGRAYLKFIESLAGAVSKIDITWQSPRPEYGGSVELTEANILSSIAAVKQQAAPDIKVFNIQGVLKGLNLKRKTYLIVSDTGEEYSGYMETGASESSVIQTAQMNREYIATIEEKRETPLALGASKAIRKLIALNLLSKEEEDKP